MKFEIKYLLILSLVMGMMNEVYADCGQAISVTCYKSDGSGVYDDVHVNGRVGCFYNSGNGRCEASSDQIRDYCHSLSSEYVRGTAKRNQKHNGSFDIGCSGSWNM